MGTLRWSFIPPKKMLSPAEKLWAKHPVVPLACPEGGVARRPERLAEQCHLILGPWLLWAAVKRPAGHQARARADAHRALERALDEAVGESGPPGEQAVEAGRSDRGIVERSERAESLIVGEQDQEVRPRRSAEAIRPEADGQQRGGAGPQAVASVHDGSEPAVSLPAVRFLAVRCRSR